MKKILLHICCGPCATATIRRLQADNYEVFGYYYNPNIHPDFEYRKRLMEAKKLADNLKIELIEEKYNPKEYFEAIRGNEVNQKERCPKCWKLRIEKTAKKAEELGIKSIATTLRISPYQNQEKLLEIGNSIAKKYNLNFYNKELVCCFNESINLSKEQGMYRQKYCGCVFSRDYR